MEVTVLANATLPDWLTAELNSCPAHGAGVHSYLFRIARQLLAHYSREDVVRLLATATANCGRRVPAREIVSAVNAAARCAWRPTSCGTKTEPQLITNCEGFTVAPAWPEVNQEQRE